MKNSPNNQKFANLSYSLNGDISNYGATSINVTHFAFEHEFTDSNPLVARVQAFESFDLAYKAMMHVIHSVFFNTLNLR